MKNVVSTYLERWNILLGVIFVAIVILMPNGLVPGSPQTLAARSGASAPRLRRRAAMSALTVCAFQQAFGGLPVTNDVSLT